MDNYNYNCNCCRRASCSLYGIIISVLLGVAFAILTFAGLLTAATTLNFILIASLVLIPITLFAALLGSGESCICRYTPQILLGIAGAIISGIVARFLSTLIGTTLTAIFTGISALFLALALSAIFCIIICLSQCCSELE